MARQRRNHGVASDHTTLNCTTTTSSSTNSTGSSTSTSTIGRSPMDVATSLVKYLPFASDTSHQKDAFEKQIQASLRWNWKLAKLHRLRGNKDGSSAPLITKESLAIAKVDASLKLSKQLLSLQFTFRKFSIRWRIIKMQSSLQIWKRNINMILEKEAHFLSLEKYAVKIQRCFRAKTSYVLALKQRRERKTQMELLEREKEELLKEYTKRSHMAIKIQKLWRGHWERAQMSIWLQTRLNEALAALSANQLFGNLVEVQIKGFRSYGVAQEDEHSIMTAHQLLKVIGNEPGWFISELVEATQKIEAICQKRQVKIETQRGYGREAYYRSKLKENTMKQFLHERRERIRIRNVERYQRKQNLVEAAKKQDDQTKMSLQEQLKDFNFQQTARIRECHDMEQEEINQRAFSSREAHHRHCMRQHEANEIQNAKRTTKFSHSAKRRNRLILAWERKKMSEMDEEQRLQSHFARRFDGAQGGHQKPDEFTVQEKLCLDNGCTYVIRAIYRFFPHLHCRASKICPMECYVEALNESLNQRLYISVNNIAEILGGSFLDLSSPVGMFLKVDEQQFYPVYVRREVTQFKTLCDIRLIRNASTVEIQIQLNDETLGTTTFTIDLHCVCCLLRPTMYHYLLPRNHEKFMIFLADRLRLTSKSQLVLMPEAYVSFRNRSNSMTTQFIVDKITGVVSRIKQ